MKDEDDDGPTEGTRARDPRDAWRLAETLLGLGAAYSDVKDTLIQEGCTSDPEILIADVVDKWVDEDKAMSMSRRAVQRRRLLRQIRQAMSDGKVGDAVRAEAILARVDDQEAEAEANKTQDDFEVELTNHSEEDIEFFAEHGRWPNDDDRAEDSAPEEENVH